MPSKESKIQIRILRRINGLKLPGTAPWDLGTHVKPVPESRSKFGMKISAPLFET